MKYKRKMNCLNEYDNPIYKKSLARTQNIDDKLEKTNNQVIDGVKRLKAQARSRVAEVEEKLQQAHAEILQAKSEAEANANEAAEAKAKAASLDAQVKANARAAAEAKEAQKRAETNFEEAHALAEEGAKVADIDRVIYDFGWAMGPFAVNDLAGNDVGWRIRKRHKQEGKYDNLRYTSTVADQLCELGRYGQKTNRGFYIYDPQTRQKQIDPEVDMMFEKVAKEKGIERREIDDDEILHRLSWALLNTGCMILEEGFALRASDIDVTYAYGYGYPHWRGGPMRYAQDYGLKKVLEDIERFRQKNSDMWPKCNYLEELVKNNKTFN
mgnify:CR=1 FL=1